MKKIELSSGTGPKQQLGYYSFYPSENDPTSRNDLGRDFRTNSRIWQISVLSEGILISHPDQIVWKKVNGVQAIFN